MARSSYIYLVFYFDNHTIAGAYTVKHEMLSALKGMEKDFHVYRTRDGELDFKITKIDLTDEKS